MSAEVTQAATHIPGVVDLSDDTTTVYGGPAQLVGVHIQSMSAHAVPIKNGVGGTTLFSIPASTPAGKWVEGGNMRFSSSLYVDPDNSATGTITVVYSPIHDGVVG